MQTLGQTRYVLRLVTPLYIASMLISFCQGMLAPTLPLFAAEFDVSYGMIGLILAGDALGMMLGDIPGGLLLRYMGKRPAMVLGLALAVASSFGLYFSGVILAALAFRILTGFGLAIYAVARMTYIADVVPMESRGRILALFGGTFRVGRFLGPIAGGLVGAAFSLRAPFLFIGGLCLVTMLVVAVFLREPEQPVTGEEALKPAPVTSMLSVLTSQARFFLTAGTGSILMMMVRTGPQVVIPLFGAGVVGLNVNQIGWILGLSGLIDTLLFLPAGWLMDRLGRKVAIISSMALLGAGMAAIPFTTGYGGLILAGILLGIGNGLGAGTLLTIGADMAPYAGRGEFMALWNLLNDIGSTGGPLAIGWVADLLSLSATAWFIAGTGFLGAFIFYVFVPETLAATRKRFRFGR